MGRFVGENVVNEYNIGFGLGISIWELGCGDKGEKWGIVGEMGS
jgi:hypothetical protein